MIFSTQTMIFSAGSIAYGKKTWQSSDRKKTTSWKAVDGNASPNFYDGSCATTLGKWTSEWWAVDLENTVLVQRVVITNRVDCCCKCTQLVPLYLMNFQVLIGNIVIY